jgi:hypothetical protein
MTLLIESKFNILSNDRPDGGNGRKYDLDNVGSVIESHKWHVEQRQLLGYYGHPSSLFLKEGLQNQPSNVCVKLKLNGNIVEHAQQILETDTGRVVTALHKAGAGGWSWRASGQDGGRNNGTMLETIAGFDFVHSPSYTQIKESVNDENGDYARLRYHLIDEGLNADFADGFLQSINDGVSKEINRLKGMVAEAEQKTREMSKALTSSTVALNEDMEDRLALVKESLSRSPYALTEGIIDILAKGVADTSELRQLMEALTGYQGVDFDALPLKAHKKETIRERFEEDKPDFDLSRLFDHGSRSW